MPDHYLEQLYERLRGEKPHMPPEDQDLFIKDYINDLFEMDGVKERDLTQLDVKRFDIKLGIYGGGDEEAAKDLLFEDEYLTRLLKDTLGAAFTETLTDYEAGQSQLPHGFDRQASAMEQHQALGMDVGYADYIFNQMRGALNLHKRTGRNYTVNDVLALRPVLSQADFERLPAPESPEARALSLEGEKKAYMEMLRGDNFQGKNLLSGMTSDATIDFLTTEGLQWARSRWEVEKVRSPETTFQEFMGRPELLNDLTDLLEIQYKVPEQKPADLRADRAMEFFSLASKAGIELTPKLEEQFRDVLYRAETREMYEPVDFGGLAREELTGAVEQAVEAAEERGEVITPAEQAEAVREEERRKTAFAEGTPEQELGAPLPEEAVAQREQARQADVLAGVGAMPPGGLGPGPKVQEEVAERERREAAARDRVMSMAAAEGMTRTEANAFQAFLEGEYQKAEKQRIARGREAAAFQQQFTTARAAAQASPIIRPTTDILARLEPRLGTSAMPSETAEAKQQREITHQAQQIAPGFVEGVGLVHGKPFGGSVQTEDPTTGKTIYVARSVGMAAANAGVPQFQPGQYGSAAAPISQAELVTGKPLTYAGMIETNLNKLKTQFDAQQLSKARAEPFKVTPQQIRDEKEAQYFSARSRRRGTPATRYVR